MNLDKNVKNVQAFLPPEKEKIILSSGKEFEYSLRIGMGHSMNARSKLVELLKHCGIKYEDLFGSVEANEGEAEDELKKRREAKEKIGGQAQGRLRAKFMEADETFRKLIVEVVAIILKQKTDWVDENVEEEDILGIVVPFFLMRGKNLTLGWYKTITRIGQEKTKMQEEEIAVMSKLVIESTSHGVSEKTEEIPPSQTSQDSSTPSQQGKS